MGIDQKILVTAKGLRTFVASVLCACAALTACGQKGNLYMPNDPEFQQRATLPQIVRRQFPGDAAAPAPATAASTATTPAAAPRKTTTPAASSPVNAASAAGR